MEKIPHVIWENVSTKMNKMRYLIYMPYYNIATLDIPLKEEVPNTINRMIQYGLDSKTTFHNVPYMPIYEPDEHELVTSRKTISEMISMVNNSVSFIIRNKDDVLDIQETIERYLMEMEQYLKENKEYEYFLSGLYKLKSYIDRHSNITLSKENNTRPIRYDQIISLFVK